MPKVLNTSIFLDKWAYIIDQMYIDRLGCEPSEITIEDFENPRTLRALTELRFYRLPLYFKVPLKIKARLHQFLMERELLVHSPYFIRKRKQLPCNICKNLKPLGDGLCVDCKMDIVANNTSSLADAEMYRLSIDYPWLTPHIGTFRSLPKLKKLLTEDSIQKFETPPDYKGWHSPKAILLATVIGCRSCNIKYDTQFIWDVPNNNFEWEDGLCPECLPQSAVRDGYWSHIVDPRRYGYLARYDYCTACANSDYDYALWGMCEACYMNWQDQYLSLPVLLDFVSKYGALASLLIRCDIPWLQYLSRCLPKRNKEAKREGELQPMYIVRTLKDANLDINEIILRRGAKHEIPYND